MNYLDYNRNDDTTPETRAKDKVADAENAVRREMHHAREWQKRPASSLQEKAIANHVARAREANRALLAAMRDLRTLEVAS